jgi:hypothetical protein
MILDQFEFNDAVPNGMFGFAPRLLIGAAILPRAKAFGQDIGRSIYSVIIHARLHGMVARGRSGHRRIVVVVVVGRHGKASCRRTTATGSHGSAFFGFDHSIVGVQKTKVVSISRGSTDLSYSQNTATEERREFVVVAKSKLQHWSVAHTSYKSTSKMCTWRLSLPCATIQPRDLGVQVCRWRVFSSVQYSQLQSRIVPARESDCNKESMENDSTATPPPIDNCPSQMKDACR